MPLVKSAPKKDREMNASLGKPSKPAVASGYAAQRRSKGKGILSSAAKVKL